MTIAQDNADERQTRVDRMIAEFRDARERRRVRAGHHASDEADTDPRANEPDAREANTATLRP